MASRARSLAEQSAIVLADAKILCARKFIDGAYATDARVSPEHLHQTILRELSFDLARAMIEQVPLHTVLAKDEVPNRGPGYDYTVEIVVLTRRQLEELSRLNRDIRRAPDDPLMVTEAAAPEREGPIAAGPAEAPPTDWWRWRFPRAGRYYAMGRYVDIAEAGEERDLPPGYPLWITAEGVHAERLPG